MKKLIYIAFAGIVLCTSACKKLLNEDVRSTISNLYVNTPSGVEDGVRACYSYLRIWYGSQSGGWMTVFGTDEYQNGSADATYANYTANLNSANVTTGGIWNGLYTGINTCNSVIEAIPNVAGISDATKKIRMAEVRFLRAHYYFILVQQFGPLDLRLTSTVSASRVAVRAPIADVYKVIVDDVTFAIANLPATTSEYGRVTIPIAKHMLAKVYLTRAGGTAAQTTDYANAATLAKDVIATGGYKLLDDFAELWAQPSKPNSETMWACQYSSNILTGNGNGALANAANFDFGTNYEAYPGMLRDLNNGRSFSHYRLTTWLMNLYDKTIDSRWSKTYKTTWITNKPGSFTINGKSVALKLGDTALVTLDHEITTAQRNAIRYTVLTPSQFTNLTWIQNNKFADSLRLAVNNSIGVKDFPIYRLGETYLIAAEALTMSGKPDEAVTFINALRTRAAIKGATPTITAANVAAMQVSASALNIDFILDERARELNGEYMRWNDLVRTGKLLERVKKYNPGAALLIQPYHVLRPIPQTQIDRTDGATTAFPQNAGY